MTPASEHCQENPTQQPRETHAYAPGPRSRALAFPHALSADSSYDDPAVTSEGDAGREAWGQGPRREAPSAVTGSIQTVSHS